MPATTRTQTNASLAVKQGKEFPTRIYELTTDLFESSHRKAYCPNAEAMTCRYCHQPGHMVKDCPDKPAMVCDNCGEDGT